MESSAHRLNQMRLLIHKFVNNLFAELFVHLKIYNESFRKV